MGLDPASQEARRAVGLARDNVTWHAGPDAWHGNPLFAGEVEPRSWSQFHTTICVLEGLWEHERATGGSPAVTAARERGQEYLLERRLLRRLSTGEVIDPAWTQFSFPTGYHYDVLRGLEYLRSAGITPDARMAEAIDLVASKRDAEGRWPLENVHPYHLVRCRLDAGEGAAAGRPSRWNTLRALRVLDWYSARD
jgi:hypothetical protein